MAPKFWNLVVETIECWWYSNLHNELYVLTILLFSVSTNRKTLFQTENEKKLSLEYLVASERVKVLISHLKMLIVLTDVSKPMIKSINVKFRMRKENHTVFGVYMYRKIYACDGQQPIIHPKPK